MAVNEAGLPRVIDVHGHIVAPAELYAYREFLIGTRGHYGRQASVGRGTGASARVPQELLVEYANVHLEWLDAVGTDVQLVSARPYGLMHSEKPKVIVHHWAQAVNDAIATQVAAHPTRFQGIANLPQIWNEPISETFEELERCVSELGFVGALVNPDPSEGRGTDDVPPLGDEYWYPLYEKLTKLQVPMFIHSCGCVTQRKSQSLHFILEESIAVMSLAQSPVFDLFPTLKVIVPHGGGAIPYQIGRFRGVYWKSLGREDMSFDEAIRHNLYYDTCLYTPESLEFLLRTMGCDNVVFGTERPGDGSHRHSSNQHGGAGSVAWADDLKTIIEEIPGIKAEELDKVFSGNILSAYPRLADKFGAAHDGGE